MYSSPLTFVSSFHQLKDTPYFLNRDDWTHNNILQPWLQSNIPIILFIDPDTYSQIIPLWECPPNIVLIPIEYPTIIPVEKAKTCTLPIERNVSKDTMEYILYSHSRPLFLQSAIELNPFHSTHIAWIDICAPLEWWKSETHSMLAYMKWISTHKFSDTPFLAIPGGWDKPIGWDKPAGLDKPDGQISIISHIHWRFCGAFLIGNLQSVRRWTELYLEYFPQFLDTYSNTLVWDVNYWAWLELICVKELEIEWYWGNHDTTLLTGLSPKYYSEQLPFKCVTTYPYPEIPQYLPGSASCVNYRGKYWLVTRFVNYWMYPNGYYLFHDSSGIIDTINMLSELDPDTMTPISYTPISHEILDVSNTPLKKYDGTNKLVSHGVEDIRLYVESDKLRFIGTTIEYSPNGKARMITGCVDIENACLCEARILPSPDETNWCEKNWIPIPTRPGEFIYKWTHEGIIVVNEKGDTYIIKLCQMWSKIYGRFRGSTPFVQLETGEYMSVVHWSEEGSPRKYYHCMVKMNDTFTELLDVSKTFVFNEKKGIEFTIGMIRSMGNTILWTSTFDRDAKMVYLVSDE